MAREFTDEDFDHMYNLVSEQLNEDRESLNELYKELREHVREHPTRYVDMGETLAKLADLRLKQTSQVVDVLKLVEKSTPKGSYTGFSEEELRLIDEKVKDDGNE